MDGYCWRRHEPDGTRLDAQLRIQIDAQGQATGAQATTTHTQDHRKTLTCIEDATRRWLFPQPADRQPVKVVVLLTFALQP